MLLAETSLPWLYFHWIDAESFSESINNHGKELCSHADRE